MAAASRLTRLLIACALALMGVPAVVAGAGAATEERPPEVTVQMVGLRMVPDRLEITTGTTVTWVNSEPVNYPGVDGSHQIVADDGSWESPNIAPGTRWSHRFDQPGSFGYHCTRHSTGTGEIVVTGEPVVDRPVEREVAITEDNPDDPKTWGFRPPDLVIETGTTVVWRNNGKSVHTVTAEDKSFDSGDIAPGATWSYRFDTPGAFAYHCTPHPWMKASIRVVVPGGEAPPPPPTPAPRDEHAAAPGHRPSSAQAERGRGPVRHDVDVVEPDPADPTSWAFDPPTLDVRAGDTVVWRNTGSTSHTVTADDGSFDSGSLAPGATWSRTFDAPAFLAYHCTPHPWMKGVVRVAALEGPPPAPPPGFGATAATSPRPRPPEPVRAGTGPVRRQVDIVEPDLSKAMEWGFSPSTVDIRAGDTVVWRNTGMMQHTVTADDGSFDSGVLDPGATWSRRFDTPGVYAFHCTPHPWMKGVVRVSDAEGGPVPSLPADLVPAAPGEQAFAPPMPGTIGIVPSGRDAPTSLLGMAMVMAVLALMLTGAAAWCWPTREELADLRQSFHAR